jgi:hypothetical protein
MIQMFRRSVLAALVLVSVPLLPGSAGAQEQPAPGYHQHDGFFLRMILGPSVLVATSKANGEDVTLSGSGGTFHIALGYNVMPRLILYGEVFDDVTLNPKVEIGDSGEMDIEDTTLGAFGAGVGLAYYFRNNFFLSASAVASQLRAETGGEEPEDSATGFGVNAVFGREWFVSDNWALGFAGQIFFANVPDEAMDESWKVLAVGLGLSATYD